MSARPTAWSLAHAALNGAIVGALVILMNLYFESRLAATGVIELVMMLAGGAGGGALLFLTIALFARALGRRAK